MLITISKELQERPGLLRCHSNLNHKMNGDSLSIRMEEHVLFMRLLATNNVRIVALHRGSVEWHQYACSDHSR